MQFFALAKYQGKTMKLHYEGTVTFNYNDKQYVAQVAAKADYFYQHAVFYYKDGSGQPEDEDLEIDTVSVISLNRDWEKYNKDAEFKSIIDELIDDELYMMDYDRWSGYEDRFTEENYG